MNLIARYRKAVMHVIGVAASVYFARYGDAIWPIVTAWVLSTLGVASMPNRLSTTDIRYQPNFLKTAAPMLSNNPPTYPRRPAAPPVTVTADPNDCTDMMCPIHHPNPYVSGT
ncbi:MAG TPA: hypothetical protein VLU24_10255 [Mycobacterium sp.]|nr:hypothetical protein [Mycobacterium sp.]